MAKTLARKGWLTKIALLGIVLACAVALTACGTSNSSEQASSEQASSEQASTEQATQSEQTASDEATQSDGTLKILYEEDDSLINNYSLIAVNPDAPFVDADGNAVNDVKINTVGAKALIDWILSDEGIEIIANYGTTEFGESLFTINDDVPTSTAEIPQATDETKTIRLSTTTSVNDSGLLQAVLPIFEDEYGYEVEVYSAGTGKAIANAKDGNADLILVHSKSQEEEFINDGFAYAIDGQDAERLTFMHNYFVIVGPATDPAGVATAPTAEDAFQLIADGQYQFVSRGDMSGTHTKEVSLWPEDLNITTDAESIAEYTDWYNYSNAGMGACLLTAKEKDGYILSDKATFLTFENNNEKPLS